MLTTDQHLALLMVLADQRIAIVNLAHELEETKKMLPQAPESEQQEMFAPNGSSPVPSV